MKEEHPPGFDAYAENYDRALAAGLSVTGEHKEYFAAMRIKELGSLLERLDFPVNQVLDFGCGTGSSVPFLLDLKGVTSVTGVDVSEKSLEIARKQDANGRARFDSLQQFRPDGHFDLVFCNGVFHHIPPKDRSSAINTVFNALRSGGIFAFWENNPWNPGTRYVMSRIEFDRDAVTLSPPNARKLLREGCFRIIRTDFFFYFPRFLKYLRPSELFLKKLPFGAQYQIIAQKID